MERGLRSLPAWRSELRDAELLSQLTEMYEDGAHVTEASRLLSAAAWINPLASGLFVKGSLVRMQQPSIGRRWNRASNALLCHTAWSTPSS